MGEVFYLINGRGILKGISGILQHQEKKKYWKCIGNKNCNEKRIILFLISPPPEDRKISCFICCFFVSSFIFFHFFLFFNGTCLPGPTWRIVFQNVFHPVTEFLSFRKVSHQFYFVLMVAANLLVKNFVLKGDLFSLCVIWLRRWNWNVYMFHCTSESAWSLAQ